MSKVKSINPSNRTRRSSTTSKSTRSTTTRRTSGSTTRSTSTRSSYISIVEIPKVDASTISYSNAYENISNNDVVATQPIEQKPQVIEKVKLNLDEELNNTRSLHDAINNQDNINKKEMDELKIELNKLKNENNNLKNQNNQISSNNENLKKKLQSYENNVNKVNNDNNNFKNNQNKLNNEINHLNQINNNLRKEIEYLKNELNMANQIHNQNMHDKKLNMPPPPPIPNLNPDQNNDKNIEQEWLAKEQQWLNTKKQLEDNIANLTLALENERQQLINKLQMKSKEAQGLIDEKLQQLEENKKSELKEAKNKIYEDVLFKFIEPINLFEQTIISSQNNPAIANYLQGFNMIVNMFKDVLAIMGVDEIDIKPGDEFNADWMSAFDVVDDSEFTTNKVVKVVSKGYVFNGKILKFASVLVSK